jgi:integrase
VSDFLDRWLESKRKKKRRESTLTTYGHLLAPVRAHFVGLRLQRLTPEHLDDLFAHLESDGVTENTQRSIYKVLRMALVYAQTRRSIITNPAENVEAPEAVHPARKMLDGKPQLLQLLDAADRDETYIGPLVTLLATSGARLGECLALSWGSVDLKAGTVRIERTLSDGDGKALVFTPPKTEAGKRTVGIPQRAVAALERHRSRLGATPIGSRLVFANVFGAPLRRANVYRGWYKLLDAAKLPRVNVHSLRHLHCSLLLDSGQPITAVSKRLGHASARITADIYSHGVVGQDEAAVKALEQITARS